MYWRVRSARPLYGNPYSEPLHARDAVADGEAHERRQVADAELERNAAAVGVDAARGNAQLRRNLFARSAGDHPLEHLPLAPAEALERVVGKLAQLLDVRQHIARLAARCIVAQRRALARPEHPAIACAVPAVARHLRGARQQLFHKRLAVVALGDLGERLAMYIAR